MHDGIHLEKAGIPSATICTDRFEVTARAMASMWGAPGYPVVYTPHPLGGLDRASVRQRATELLDQVVSVVTGMEVAHPSARL